MSNIPLVTHYVTSETADRTGCGRYMISLYKRTTDPSKVTCRACLAKMSAHPVTHTEENVNA